MAASYSGADTAHGEVSGSSFAGAHQRYEVIITPHDEVSCDTR